MTVIDEIAAERGRQVEQEGWTAEHDDGHDYGDFAKAAMAYCQSSFSAADELDDDVGFWWPWADGFKRKSPRRDLIRAAALIVAEIERLDRQLPEGDSERG